MKHVLTFESLELIVSPSALAAPVITVDTASISGDDSPYDPDGDPGDLPTTDDPIVLPPKPPSGPVGPA